MAEKKKKSLQETSVWASFKFASPKNFYSKILKKGIHFKFPSRVAQYKETVTWNSRSPLTQKSNIEMGVCLYNNVGCNVLSLFHLEVPNQAVTGHFSPTFIENLLLARHFAYAISQRVL